jgi:hypothetical protein
MAQVNISSPETGGYLHHVISLESYGWGLTLPTILSVLSPVLASVFRTLWKYYSPSQRLVKGIPIVGGSKNRHL